MQHSVVRLTMDSPNVSKTIWSTTKCRTPCWAPKTHPSYRCTILGTKRRTLPQNPSFRIFWKQVRQQVRQRFFQFQAEKQQIRLYPGQGLNFRTEEVHHSRPFFETWERWKALHRNISTILTISFASFVAPLDTLPRTVQNPAWLLPKPKHPSLIRTSPHLLAQTQKKTEQSSRLHMTQGLC